MQDWMQLLFGLGLVVLKTTGSLDAVLAHDAELEARKDDWFVHEVRHFMKRVLKRLDVTARSVFALVEPFAADNPRPSFLANRDTPEPLQMHEPYIDTPVRRSA